MHRLKGADGRGKYSFRPQDMSQGFSDGRNVSPAMAKTKNENVSVLTGQVTGDRGQEMTGDLKCHRIGVSM
jgi:hypothetical protein